MSKNRYLIVYSILSIVFILSLMPVSAHPGHHDDDKPSPTAMASPTWTATATHTVMASPMWTATATHTASPTLTPTLTHTATATETAAASATAAILATETEELEASATSTATTTATAETPAEVTPEVEATAEITADPVITQVPTASPVIEIYNSQPTATPTLPANLSWVYLVGDTFEGADEEQPYQMDATWYTTTVTRGNAVQPSDTTTLRYSEFELFDLALLSDIYLVQGNLNFMVRQSRAGAYRLQVSADGTIALYWNRTELSVTQLPDPLSGGWHNIRLMVVDYSLQLYVDETLVLSYLDSNHVPAGTTSIYGNAGTAVRLDNVEIWIPENLERSQPILDAVEAANPRATEAPRNSSADPTPEGSGALPAENSFWTNSVDYMQGGQNEFRYFRSPTCNHSIAAGDVSGLIAAINSANSDGQATVICLAAGTYTLTTSYVIQDGDNGLPLITGEMHLYGDGAGAIIQRDTLTSAPDFRFFRIEETGDLTLENLTLQYGVTISSNNGGYGGAIYNEGSLTILNSAFNENGAEDEGGAIYNHTGAIIDIIDSTFTENGVYYDDGGAIDNHGDVTITNTLFDDNHALNDDGGALWNDYGATLTITNSTITNNTAAGNGGAITSFGALFITDSTFDTNTAGVSGGALYLESGSIGTISNSSIINNTATNDDGGGVYTLLDIVFNNVDLNGNTAGDRGGAIYASDVTVTIQNTSQLNDNTASGNGGAIFSSDNGSGLTVSNAEFQRNSSGLDGGAIYLVDSTHTIDNTLFYDNGASRHGGAVYTDANGLTIHQDTIFELNNAGNDGGAIYAYGTFNVSDSVFKDNTAVDQGGAYRGYASTSSSITDSCIFGNQASDTSGIYSARSNFNATNNWWGSSDGPDGSGSGAGDEVNWGVNYSPFVGDATCLIFGNIAPDLSVVGADATYTEHDLAELVATDVTITDVDDTELDSATITILNPQDGTDEILNVTLSGNFQAIYDENTHTLTVTDSIGSASLADFETILETLTYENTKTNPDLTQRQISIVVNDGQDDSNTVTITVDLATVNDPPTLELTGVDATYVEDQPPVAVLNDGSIEDVDSNSIDTVTIEILNAENGSDEILDVTDIVGITSTYNAANQTLTLQNDGSATIADFETVINSLTYENTSDIPGIDSRDIEITVTDDGGAESLSEVVRVYLDDRSDTPIVDLNGAGTGTDHSESYVEGGQPASISTMDAGITDADSTQLTSMHVTIENYQIGDVLNVTLSNTDLNVLNNSGVLTITGSAPLSDYQDALQTLTYASISGNPDTTDRIVRVTVNDGENESTAVTGTISVSTAPTAPIINLDIDNISGVAPDSTATYVIGLDPVNVTNLVSITDPDSTQLSELSITLDNPLNGASEYLTITDPGGFTVTGNGTNTITINGDANLSVYEDILESLTYTNNAATPDMTTRTVSISVEDTDTLLSVIVESTITLNEQLPIPGNTQCFEWDTLDEDHNWSEPQGQDYIQWTEDGMYAASPQLSPMTVAVRYTLPANTSYILNIGSNGVLPFTVHYGDPAGIINNLASQHSQGAYIIPGDLVELRWQLESYTNIEETLIFDFFCLTEITQPDIKATYIDPANAILDGDLLTASGSVDVMVENPLSIDVSASFDVVVFADLNHNQQFDSGSDTVLATQTVSGLLAYQSQLLTMPVSGQIHSEIAPLYAFVDSDSVISEIDEANNIASTEHACTYLDVQQITLPFTTNQVQTITGLSPDRTYEVELSGRGTFATNSPYVNYNQADSFYWDIDAYKGHPVLFPDSINEGLYINSTYPVAQPFATNHLYYVQYPGTTGTLSFQLVDINGSYGNNAGQLNVRVYPVDCHGEPDIAATEIDSSQLFVDPQSLLISGTVSATIENLGENNRISDNFTLTFFEDTDGNYLYSPGTDNVIASVEQNSLPVGAIQTVGASVSGTVNFSNSPIYAFVDSDDSISESDETNNLISTVAECAIGSGNPFAIDPVVEWSWSGGSIYTNYDQVMNTPVVFDINGDAIPDVIFTSFNNSPFNAGVLRAVSGDDGSEIWSIPTSYNYDIDPLGELAVGDIDNDNEVEIVTSSLSGYILAFNADGSLLWETTTDGWGDRVAPALADIEQDGDVEVIVNDAVFDGQTGSLDWHGGHVSTSYYNGFSVVVDLDLDGTMEIVIGGVAYDHDGGLHWLVTGVPTTPSAVANLDNDPYPEIVAVGYDNLYIVEHDGSVSNSWSINGFGGPPTIADVDGDGEPEITVAGSSLYMVYEVDGMLLWSAMVDDGSSQKTGSSVFDFDGDGQVEVVYSDQTNLWVFDGATGSELWSISSPSGTWREMPVVVDVDADGNAEIIMVSNDYYRSGFTGVRVFGDSGGSWVSTRRIWNQHTYHITNINDDGTIPQYETNNWEIYNNYRQNILPDGCATGQPDLAASQLIRTYDGADYELSVRIGNGGNRLNQSGISVEFYDGDPANGGSLLATETTDIPLDQGEFTTVTVDVIPDGSPNWNKGPIWVVVDSGDVVSESNELNNIYNSNVYLTVPPNEAPLVTINTPASPYTLDLSITDTISLAGTVTDSTFPVGQVDTSWVLVSGSSVVFTTPTDSFTTTNPYPVSSDATFSHNGTYEIVLRAADGEFTANSSILTVEVIGGEPDPATIPPPHYILDVDACLATPGHADRIDSPTDITVTPGTVLTDAALYYWPAHDPQAYVLMEAGLTIDASSNPYVATFDTTLLANDTYGIQLVGTDANSNQVVCGAGVIVTGEYKPGRVVLSTTDFTLPLAGLPITVGRTYDSLERNTQSDFGYGWSLALGNPRLEIDDSNNITLTLPSGERRTFYWGPIPYPISYFERPNYQNEAGEYGSLSTNGCELITSGICFLENRRYGQSVTQITYEDPYGREFTYGTDGTLISIRDLNDNLLEFEDDGIYNREIDANNPLVTIDRDENNGNRIDSITDNDDNVYQYIYDGNSDLINVILPDDTPLDTQDNPTITYGYYTEAEGLAHFFKEGTDPRGNEVVTTTYDDDGRLETVTNGYDPVTEQPYVTTYSYNLNNNETIVTNPDNSQSIMTYDDRGNLLTEEDELGRITVYDYDDDNNLLFVCNAEIEPENCNENNNTTSYEYDPQGNRTSVTNADGTTVISATYNDNGAPEQLTDANGITRNIEYNSVGLPSTASDPLGTIGSYLWDDYGSPEVVCDASIDDATCSETNFTTQYVYDDYGNVEYMCDSRIDTTTDDCGENGNYTMYYEYDDMGRRTRAESRAGTGSYTLTEYDALGNVLEVRTYSVGSPDEFVSRTSYIYDENGNRRFVTAHATETGTHVDDRMTEYTYDDNNRVTRVINADDSYSDTEYDWRGNVVKQETFGDIDNEPLDPPALNRTCYVYNIAGELTDVKTNCDFGILEVITHYEYDAAGRRTHTFEDWNGTDGVLVSYVEYDTIGRVSRTVDAAGTANRQGIVDWSNDTNLQLPAGAIATTYTYDDAGQLITVANHFGWETHYLYDVRGRRVRTIYPDDTPTILFDNPATETVYDPVGRVINQINQLGYQTRYAYNTDGELLGICDASIGANNCNSGNFTTTYDYDENGRRESVTNAAGEMTTYDYDSLNRVISVCGPVATECTEYTYNEFGQQDTVTDARDIVTTYYYDEMGRPIEIKYATNTPLEQSETITYTARGQRSTVRYGGYESSYGYDPVGRLSSTQVCELLSGSCDPNNTITTATYTYDNRGRQESVTNANQVTTRMVYDGAGRIQMQIANWNDTAYPDPENFTLINGVWFDNDTNGNPVVFGNNDANIITAYQYDDLGRRQFMWDVDGNLTQYEYEEYTNRLDTVFYPDGTRERYVYDDLGQRLGVCDGNVSPTVACDADQFSTAYSYDEPGRLRTVTNGEGETVSYGYDGVGRILSITNGRGNDVRSFGYEDGRLKYECDASANGNCTSSNYEVEYTYDANGNLTREDWLADGDFNIYSYDALNRLTLETYGANDPNTQIEYGYSYDARGMLQYVYDGDPNATQQPNTLTTYTYDLLGNPESVVHSDGQAVYYGYDDLGRRTSVETQINSVTQTEASYTYDAMNRVISVTDENAAQTEFAYNPLGQLTTITRPASVGITTTYIYGDTDILVQPQGIDVNGQIYSHTENPYQVYEINHSHTTNGLISQYDYTYDSVGNRLSMDVTTPDGIGGTQTDEIDYLYDHANRLVSESYALSNVTISTEYQYDRAGNRTVEIDRTNNTVTAESRYSYNNNDELEEVYFVDEFMYQKYEYDTRGNLTEITSWHDGVTDTQIGSTTTLNYNARDQLLSFGDGGSTAVTYAYDHNGRRIGENVGGVTTDYLWDEFSRYGDVLLAIDPSDTTGYTLANGMLVSQTVNGTTDYFLQDAQYSTVAIADDMGAVTSTYSYDAFGNLDENILDIDIETDYLYTGQFFDYENTELYNLRARQYDPSVGRFLTRDTWAYNYRDPFELNRYVYGANNPATFVDPSGHFISFAIQTATNVINATKSNPLVGSVVGASIGALTGALHAATIYRGINHGMCGSMELPDRTSFILGATLSGAVIGGIVGAGFPLAATYAPAALPYVKIATGIVGTALGIYGAYTSGRQFIGDYNNHGEVNLCAALNGGLSILSVYGSLQMLGDGLVEGPVGQWVDDAINQAFKGPLDDGVAPYNPTNNTDNRRVVIELFSGPDSQLNPNVAGYGPDDAIVTNVDIEPYVSSGGVQGDATNLPFGSNSADEVFITNPFNEGLRNTSSEAVNNFKFAVYEEAARVLRPGGRLVVNGTRGNPYASVLGEESALLPELANLGFELANPPARGQSPYSPIPPVLQGMGQVFGRPDATDFRAIPPSSIRSITLIWNG